MLGMGGCVGKGDGVGNTMVGVASGVIVGRAVWVRATSVRTAAMVVFCTSVRLTGGVVPVGAQAARVSVSKAMIVFVFTRSPAAFVPLRE